MTAVVSKRCVSFGSCWSWTEFTPLEDRVDFGFAGTVGRKSRFSEEAMAVQSVPKPNIPRKSESSFRKLLNNPKIPFSFVLLLADAVLVALIITYVPCKLNPFTLSLSICINIHALFWFFCCWLLDTKIDWDAYMSQVVYNFLMLFCDDVKLNCSMILNLKWFVNRLMGFLEEREITVNWKGTQGLLFTPLAFFIYILPFGLLLVVKCTLLRYNFVTSVICFGWFYFWFLEFVCNSAQMFKFLLNLTN